MKVTLIILSCVAAVSICTAQQHTEFHMAMEQGMQKMDAEMKAAPMTGNPDIDFAAMMIPHHQGAVDMAKLELQHGKDPAMKKLAQQIIDQQPKEIAEMQKHIQRLQTVSGGSMTSGTMQHDMETTSSADSSTKHHTHKPAMQR
jgi:hypothetical protein